MTFSSSLSTCCHQHHQHIHQYDIMVIIIIHLHHHHHHKVDSSSPSRLIIMFSSCRIFASLFVCCFCLLLSVCLFIVFCPPFFFPLLPSWWWVFGKWQPPLRCQTDIFCFANSPKTEVTSLLILFLTQEKAELPILTFLGGNVTRCKKILSPAFFNNPAAH